MAKRQIALIGASGTVGLELGARLAQRGDLTVLQVDPRENCPELGDSEVAVLCLPEAASRAFVEQAPKGLRILDASSAHRTAPGWTYGLPELDGDQPQRIRDSSRVANPGCYATGAVLLLRPFTDELNERASVQVAITAVGGVSSGGRKMIAEAERAPFGYRLYGLDQQHRHIPEITAHTRLREDPIFMPAVASHFRGTLVQIPFAQSSLGLSAGQAYERLHAAYQCHPHIRVAAPGAETRFLAADALARRDEVAIQVTSDPTGARFVLTAQFCNLGKGAAGAAEKNLELMLNLG